MCNPATCENGKCNATGECVEEMRPSERHVPRPMTGVFAHLSADQQSSALAYRGPESHVSPPSAPYDDEVNPKTLMGARRVDLSLLPPAGVIHGAHAMMDGAEKYGPYNWREKKVPARTYIAAASRHLADWLDGEETAVDSGVHHLGHVIGCCAIVLDAMETGNLIDDRPVKGAAAAILARLESVLAARRV